MVIVSDYEDADCFSVMQPERKEGKGREDGPGTSKNGHQGTSKEEFGVTLKKKRGRKRKIRRKKIGMDELGVHEIEDSDNSEGYDALSAPEMAATAIEYLEEADEIRIKCKNIKGDLSGVMKRRIHNAKDIIRELAKTITKVPVRKEGGEAEDEACFLRMENKELQARLKEKERNCLQKEKEIQLLRNELKELGEQMRSLTKEVMEIKRNKGKDVSPKGSQKGGSPTSRSNRRMERTLEAIGKGEDTSVADDSEAMELEYLPEFTTDWSTTEDGQTFKRPFPATIRPSTSRLTALNQSSTVPRPDHLKIKEDWLVQNALEESLRDIKDSREQIRKKGTLGRFDGKEMEQETPKPQRPPRVIKTRNIQGERTDIKVLSNVQLVGPKVGIESVERREDTTTEGWMEQKSRKARRSERKLKMKDQDQVQRKPVSKKQSGKPKITRRPPRSAAVTIRIDDKDKDKFSYANVLKKARDNISLEEIGIEETRIRRTAAGSILIEIPRIGKSEVADRLATELHRVLEGEATVARPTIRGELRLFGLDDSISREEICEKVASQGKCRKEEVKVGDIKPMRSGLGMVWLQCPLASAVSLAKLEKLCIGWSVIKIELLGAREKQCFKCWRYGHLKYNCIVNIDRKGLCYRCGAESHRVKECTGGHTVLYARRLTRNVIIEWALRCAPKIGWNTLKRQSNRQQRRTQ